MSYYGHIFAAAQRLDAGLASRLSVTASPAITGTDIEAWLNAPTTFRTTGKFRFDSGLPNDAFIVIDTEFTEGAEISPPLFHTSGDWMEFFLIRRTQGTPDTALLWVYGGTAAHIAGTPATSSSDYDFELVDLGSPLAPDTWYKVTLIGDVANRNQISIRIQKDDADSAAAAFDVTVDLTNIGSPTPRQIRMALPELIPFTDSRSPAVAAPGRALWNYFGATTDQSGKTHVYWDEPTLEIHNGSAYVHVHDQNKFNDQSIVYSQPGTINLNDYVHDRTYDERAEAFLDFVFHPASRGKRMLLADATLAGAQALLESEGGDFFGRLTEQGTFSQHEDGAYRSVEY